MDTVKLSTSDIAPYSVDGLFLSSLRQELLDIVLAHSNPNKAYSLVEIALVRGSHQAKHVEQGLGPVVALTDGSISSPDDLDMFIGGVTPTGISFSFSLFLRRNKADFVATSGPRNIVAPGYKLMLDRLSERALASQARHDLPDVETQPITSRLPAPDPDLLLGMSLLVLGLATGGAVAGGWAIWPIFMLIGIVSLQIGYRPKKDSAAKPECPTRLEWPTRSEPSGTKIIDLSRPAGSNRPALEHQPLEPLEI